MNSIHLGIDFDNTLVCYDEVLCNLALERGLIDAPPTVGDTKTAIRDLLRAANRESDWTELQGYLYGVAIENARPFDGAADFFDWAARRDVTLSLVSHKTRTPYAGKPFDLREAAWNWLRSHNFVTSTSPLPENRVYFADTKQQKLRRIADIGCTHFIDDLPEFLAEPTFPAGVAKILFSPSLSLEPPANATVIQTWPDLIDLLSAVS